MMQTTRRALVAYESLFGATRRIVEAIAEGIRDSGVVAECRSVRDIPAADPGDYDLIVVGAPTHARTMPTRESRLEGGRWQEYRMRGRTLEARATEPGLREWIAEAALDGCRSAVFTTRVDLPRLLSGSAGRPIERQLRKRGAVVTDSALEALVDDHSLLLPGQTDRARAWGALLVGTWRGVGSRG